MTWWKLIEEKVVVGQEGSGLSAGEEGGWVVERLEVPKEEAGGRIPLSPFSKSHSSEADGRAAPLHSAPIRSTPRRTAPRRGGGGTVHG